MNVTVNSQKLAEELRAINRIVPAKPALSILSHVLLKADDRLRFWATDLEIGLSTTCPAVVAEPGVIALPAKRLLDMVEQFPNAEVQIIQSGMQIQVVCGAFKSRLQAMPIDDFPVAPVPEGDVYTLPTKGLQSLIQHTRYAVSGGANKYVLDAALLTITPTGIAAMVSTDSHRLSVAKIDQIQTATALTMVIPSKTLDILTAFGDGQTTELSQTQRHLFFHTGEQMLVSRTLDEKFPSYERILPRDNDKTITIQRAVLAAALRRVGQVADVNKTTNFAFTSGELAITASSAEVGDADERVAITYTGDPLTICLNWTFLLDFLNAATQPSIEFKLKDTVAPLLLTDGNDFLNVIMLMRPS